MPWNEFWLTYLQTGIVIGTLIALIGGVFILVAWLSEGE